MPTNEEISQVVFEEIDKLYKEDSSPSASLKTKFELHLFGQLIDTSSNPEDFRAYRNRSGAIVYQYNAEGTRKWPVKF